MGNDLIKVIALDPGGTTGWAKGLIREGKMGVMSGQDEWNHLALYEELKHTFPNIIICERFDYRKGGKKQEGVELISREYIGVVQLYVQQQQSRFRPGHPYYVDIYMQMPQEALGGFYKSPMKLKEAGVYKPGKPHANDAMRHLLQWWDFKEGFQYNENGFYRLEGNAVKLLESRKG